MAKVTRIKAGDSPNQEESDGKPQITREKVVVKDKKVEKNKLKERKEAEKAISEPGTRAVTKGSKAGAQVKKPFILIRPFVYLGRYLRDSWRELRQVRWPNRKATWKMVLAVIVYTALFMALILLLDMFFGWLFNLILGKG